MSEHYIVRSIRFPLELLEWLEGRAARNLRSASAECVYLLKQEKEAEEAQEQLDL